jgi:HAD superfamily hydrolase (TIGR01549 family)
MNPQANVAPFGLGRPSRQVLARPRAVFFDVDFTLIHPGPTFSGEGYQAFSARHGIVVDPQRFDRAVADAAAILDDPGDALYDAEIFVTYTRRIIEGMGGGGDALGRCAREIYDEWAACQHFALYEDVPAALETLASMGIRLGLISNSHRCLDSFQTHFALERWIAVALSSPLHGFMKPHPSIFQSAAAAIGVPVHDAVMVGDSLTHDVEGALRAGMRAVLVRRTTVSNSEEVELTRSGVPIVASLQQLPTLFTDHDVGAL